MLARLLPQFPRIIASSCSLPKIILLYIAPLSTVVMWSHMSYFLYNMLTRSAYVWPGPFPTVHAVDFCVVVTTSQKWRLVSCPDHVWEVISKNILYIFDYHSLSGQEFRVVFTQHHRLPTTHCSRTYIVGKVLVALISISPFQFQLCV